MKIFNQARDFATVKHKDQKYGIHPYSYHLDEVHSVLVETRSDNTDLLVAAYLHDVLEDTNTSPEEIKSLFGFKVLALVEAVTGRGNSRKIRNADIYRKILVVGHDAADLKLADRIVNTRESKKTNKQYYAMYKKEFFEFKHNLSTLGSPELWRILENS